MEELTKDEEIKRQINIMKKRAKEIEYKLEKTEKGEVFVAKLNGITIGNYTGPGLPGPIHEKLKANESIGDLLTGWPRELLLIMFSLYMMV